MANMNLLICDLCTKIKKNLVYKLVLQHKDSRKAAHKEAGLKPIRAEICQDCFDRLSSKIESEINLEEINKIQRKSITTQDWEEEPAVIKVLDDGSSIVPSKTDYDPGHNKPASSACSHDKTSFDPPNVRCRDCGEEWEA